MTSESIEIAGFWRRIGAAVVDGLLLGALGAGIGMLWFDRLAAMGAQGRFIGAAIAFLYFSILNSQIGQGQTVGKRLLKIRVTDAAGAPISLPRTSLRSIILLLPVTLNGMYFSMEKPGVVVSLALALCVFGAGAAVIYLYCFNRQTRQSLHDLAVGAFVVNANGLVAIRSRLWTPHFAIVLGWFCIVAVGVLILPRLVEKGDYEDLIKLHRTAQSAVPDAQIKVQRATTKGTSFQEGPSTTTALHMVVAVPIEPDSYETLADHMSAAIIQDLSEQGPLNHMTITVTYGYDIMISSMQTTRRFTHTPEEWRTRVLSRYAIHAAT